MRRLTDPAAQFLRRPGPDQTSSPGRKKHPSPSKSDLEHLELQLRRRMHLNTSSPSPVKEEDDELALSVHCAEPKDVLGTRDKNTVVRGSLPANLEADRMVQHGHGKPRHTTLPAKRTNSRIPRPIQRTQQPRSNDEFVHPAYPVADTDKSDLDELQWDDSAYQLGRNRHRDFSAPH